MPRITLFWFLSFENGKNHSSRQTELKLLFCQNLFLPPPSFLICTMNFHKKMRLSLTILRLSTLYIDILIAVATIVELQWHQMFEQYFDAKFKPLSVVFFLKIIFGKKQTQNFPQLDNSHISTIVYWNSRSFNEQSKGSEIYNSI